MKPEPLPPPHADLHETMQGVWSLVAREDYDRTGNRLIDPVLGADPVGICCFAADRFGAQFMRKGGSPSQAPVPSTAGANNTLAADGYDAYFGSYEIDATAGTITVKLEGSVMRQNVGLRATRTCRVRDDRLWIQLETTAVDGTPITRTLTFERCR